MSAALYTTGIAGRDLRRTIERALHATGSSSVSAAFAYTSTFGAAFLQAVTQRKNINCVSLITDVRDRITHPAALRLGLEHGWSIRVVDRAQGTFHPKLLIGSLGAANNIPTESRVVIVGSGNLSRGGLLANVECGFRRYGDVDILAASVVFSQLWTLGVDLTENLLADYEESFRERNKERSAADLLALGVSDELDPTDRVRTRQSPPPLRPSMQAAVAKAAWAGLESFTGEYTFQLEFPRDAGDVLRRIIAQTGQAPFVNILCEDGMTRAMRYRYYEDNGMFRLNIPNDVPGINTARVARHGVALVEQISGLAAPLRIFVRADPRFVENVEGRSFALGTWGKTPTRLYGWY